MFNLQEVRFIFYTDRNPNNIPPYVCAEFNNGRHIPLPILLDSNRCRGLQKIVIDKGIKSGKLTPARKACLQYMKAHNPRDRENFYKI